MLTIPAIEIREGHCYRTIEGEDRDVYSDSPAAMALLWRRENAKTIHLFDHDGLIYGVESNRAAILEAVEAVDVPVQLIARCRDLEECEEWLKAGVYRLFIHDLIQYDPDGVRFLIERYGPSRVCAGAITRNGLISGSWRPAEEVDAVDFALGAYELGIRRSFFTDRNYEGVMRGPNFDELRRFAASARMRVTAAGGIASVQHLWMLQELEPYGIDSVVIGRAFYENCFPCQDLWRDIERKRRHAGEEWTDGVSTATLTRQKDANSDNNPPTDNTPTPDSNPSTDSTPPTDNTPTPDSNPTPGNKDKP